MILRRLRLLAVLLLAAASSVTFAQTAPGTAVPATAVPATAAPAEQAPDVTPGAVRTQPRIDPPVAGLIRRDRDTVALTLAPGKTLLLGDFDFNGDPVDTEKVHLRQLSPGVFEVESRAYTVGYWRFSVRDTAAVFGLGEHFDTLDHAHTVVHNLSMDDNSTKGSSTYKPIPFYLSTTGYGLWLDTTGDATFDVNAGNREQIVVDAATDRLRIVLFTGQATPDARPGRFPAILSAFTALAGRAILPPYWAFAPWQARDYHQNQAQVMEDIDRTRELGLPASVILIDSPWATAYNSYQFNPKQFDDAPAMIKHLHASGYKLVLWHTSWINSKSDPPKEAGFGATATEPAKLLETSPNYKEAADLGFFVKDENGKPWVGRWWKGEGSLIDFTNPRAKHWWQDQVRQAIAAGADGFKDDDAEGAFLGDSSAGGDEAPVQFADGTDVRLMRNRYGTLYNNAVEELIQHDLKGNGVLFARSVTTGANGIGFLWGGDNDASFSPLNGLPTVVTAGLSAGMSGMPLWAADLGGYLKQPDTPYPLLLERWTEYAAFSPLMEVMSSANIVPWTFDRKPLENTPADPAATGAPALDIYKRYALLHMSLFPYRYAAAQEAARTGMPMLRALALLWQDDPRARQVKDEYLFGPDLLVAPVIDENVSRVVYLPEGEWLNLFTGEQLTGPRTLVAQAPPDVVPVYARRGTVLPRIPEDVMTLVPASESGNTHIQTLDNRRIYEILGPPATIDGLDVDRQFTDFEGRAITRSGNSLAIGPPTAYLPEAGKPTHLLVRWRFLSPTSASVDGVPVPAHTDANGAPFVEFDQAASATTRLTWQ
jgi:alpha-D-xyloside xylohydrolase